MPMRMRVKRVAVIESEREKLEEYNCDGTWIDLGMDWKDEVGYW